MCGTKIGKLYPMKHYFFSQKVLGLSYILDIANIVRALQILSQISSLNFIWNNFIYIHKCITHLKKNFTLYPLKICQEVLKWIREVLETDELILLFLKKHLWNLVWYKVSEAQGWASNSWKLTFDCWIKDVLRDIAFYMRHSYN